MFVHQDAHATYKLFAAEMKKRGYAVHEELIGKRRFVTYEAPNGQVWQTFAANMTYPIVSREAGITAKRKELAYDLVAGTGANVPFTLYLSESADIAPEKAAALLKEHGTLIVKPSNSSLSKGLTLNITEPEALIKAVAHARTDKPGVVIQEQVEGEEIRFAVLKGRVVAALLRRTSRVTGDGKTSIKDLIVRENDERKKIALEYVAYPQLSKANVDPALFEDTRVPAEGEIVELNRATMIKNGASVYDIVDTVHPSYLKIAEKLAAALDPGFLSVDMFVVDYTKPATKKNYWFIEYNTSPVLKLFYSCRDGRQVDIVPMLADEIEATLKQKSERIYEKDTVVGSFERVNFPALHTGLIVAKIDTGAYSGALHCTFIKRVVVDGVRKLRFQPLGEDNDIVETADYTITYVRSSTGHRVRRYLIETEVDIRSKRYMIRIGLFDRKDMQTQVLIGRRFLRAYNLLVDVTLNESLDTDGGGKI